MCRCQKALNGRMASSRRYLAVIEASGVGGALAFGLKAELNRASGVAQLVGAQLRRFVFHADKLLGEHMLEKSRIVVAAAMLVAKHDGRTGRQID